MNISLTTNAIGAEITDIDVRTLSDEAFADLRSAFIEHGVIFIRDQNLSPEDHIAFAKRWADIDINRFFKAVDGYPEIAEVLKEADQTGNIGGGWHTDHSYDQVPAMGSILYAREIPPSGGDTLWASMGAAYDALSDGFKEMLSGLTAVHSSRHIFGANAQYAKEFGDRLGNAESATQDAEHPVVIAHPESGRKLLYVNPGFTIGIKGWNPAEAHALLQFLYQHAQQPMFQTRFKWREGDIAMWDNRSTWHFALNDYHGHRRYLHRITLAGVPIAA
ncbi:MAG: TauD/TfdA family dioxygenase [Pseudomonadaceae bacterium]|nr:TauD/TfdA family dioxygenase [Pseudomonadaceae bacterium]